MVLLDALDEVDDVVDDDEVEVDVFADKLFLFEAGELAEEDEADEVVFKFKD